MESSKRIKSRKAQRHNKSAPYWAAVMVVFGVLSVATSFADFGQFWSSYVLDIFGPPWQYILFRGLFTFYTENTWTRIFTPTRTLLIFILVLFGIEGTQYLGWYDSTFDPIDLIAYTSLLIPVFVVDFYINKY